MDAQELLNQIRQADGAALNDIAQALTERYHELFPNDDVFYLSLPKKQPPGTPTPAANDAKPTVISRRGNADTFSRGEGQRVKEPLFCTGAGAPKASPGGKLAKIFDF